MAGFGSYAKNRLTNGLNESINARKGQLSVGLGQRSMI